ncbi:hydrogenase nickel incorporation protein HypB [Sodalis ligni]|uniref:Hydrogenase maturation factor HypB n=1 Tax=Sodalis ligni TaxID=2697027 RepID=A0A4R1N8P0_9GAMM|nr:hydrogenase nickel incorporation protein HypB [Sodalis ligni]TCL03552.1 hydrogenase nickel incorporation protein HypB [Sodalis ligni]
MCNSCGCNITTGSRLLLKNGAIRAIRPLKPAAPHSIEVLQNLLQDNDRQAERNAALFNAQGTVVFNLMSSPGSGKTALLEATIERLTARGLNIGVIEGDLETENDAVRLRKKGVPVVQITTGMACHLDAAMIGSAYQQLAGAAMDILFIENVGNLVCPASFALGQHYDVVLLSVPEGDDKPEKYPVMFRLADKVLVTKTDLLPYFDDFSVARVRDEISLLANHTDVLEVSSKTGRGMDGWLDWLAGALAEA